MTIFLKAIYFRDTKKWFNVPRSFMFIQGSNREHDGAVVHRDAFDGGPIDG